MEIEGKDFGVRFVVGEYGTKFGKAGAAGNAVELGPPDMTRIRPNGGAVIWCRNGCAVVRV